MMKVMLVAGALMVVLAGCTTSPVSNERSFNHYEMNNHSGHQFVEKHQSNEGHKYRTKGFPLEVLSGPEEAEKTAVWKARSQIKARAYENRKEKESN